MYTRGRPVQAQGRDDFVQSASNGASRKMSGARLRTVRYHLLSLLRRCLLNLALLNLPPPLSVGAESHSFFALFRNAHLSVLYR
jgi:hypothetical protein